jgi:hypothetical protein
MASPPNHDTRFEDFAECFPLYVEEEKNAASVTFNIISDFIEKQDRVFTFHHKKSNAGFINRMTG